MISLGILFWHYFTKPCNGDFWIAHGIQCWTPSRNFLRTPHHCMVFHHWYSIFFIFSFCHIFSSDFSECHESQYGMVLMKIPQRDLYVWRGVRCSLWMQSDWTISKIISTRWWVYPQVLRSKMEKPLITCKMKWGSFYTCSRSQVSAWPSQIPSATRCQDEVTLDPETLKQASKEWFYHGKKLFV